ncbi:Uncharacterized protein APZ42_006630, partial [Daphnia magna]
ASVSSFFYALLNYRSENAGFLPVCHKGTPETVLNGYEQIPRKWLRSQPVSLSEASVITRHRGLIGEMFLV